MTKPSRQQIDEWVTKEWLKEKIKEYYGTQKEFSIQSGIDESLLARLCSGSQKLRFYHKYGLYWYFHANHLSKTYNHE